MTSPAGRFLQGFAIGVFVAAVISAICLQMMRHL